MSMTLFKLTILACLCDLFNVPYLGTIFDTTPCGVQFWFWALIITCFIGLFRKEFGPMRYSEIFAKFLAKFPHYVDEATNWSPAGTNTIQVKLRDGSGLVFTYTNEHCWTLTSDVGYPVRRG